MPSTSPFQGTCGFGLSQGLAIPTTPELVFALNPEDITYEDETADSTLSIKYERFTRQLSAVFKTFQVTLYGLTAADVNSIISFANQDFLSNVLSTGRGSVEIFFAGNRLTNCYIETPIQKGPSVFRNWEDTPTEIFDTIGLKIIHPDVNWY